MRKAIVIAVREYLAVVKSKAFVVSLVLLPVMMLAPHFVERLTRRIMDVNDRHFAVIDRTSGQRVYPLLEDAVAKRNKSGTLDKSTGRQIEPRFVLEKIDPVAPQQALEQRYELAKRVREGKLFGFLEIGRDTLAITPSREADARELPDEQVVRYQSNTPTYSEFRKLATDAIHQARVDESNVPREKRE